MEKKAITLEKLTKEVQILNLNKTVSDEERFARILDNASESLKDFIIENKINDLPSLNKKLLQIEKSRIDVDKIIETCMLQKGIAQKTEEYIEEISEKLFALGASEKAIVKVLSFSTWPAGPREAKAELAQCDTIRNFKDLFEEKLARSKRKRKTQKDN